MERKANMRERIEFTSLDEILDTPLVSIGGGCPVLCVFTDFRS